MSTEIRRLQARVAAHEKRATSLEADIEEVKIDMQTNTNTLAEVKASVEEIKATMATKAEVDGVKADVEQVKASIEEIKATMATKAEIEQVKTTIATLATKAEVEQVKATMKANAKSVDQRFDHVYGALADIQANNAEVRNILADLVARLEK